MVMKKMMLSATLLGLFAVAGTSLVALTNEVTRERIEQNERSTLLDSLHALVPSDQADNDLFSDRIEVHDPALLGTPDPVTVFRARKEGKPVAVVLTPVAPDGYGGDIKLLVAINYDGTIAGVRVVSHHETPGLGDKVEAERSSWIFGFAGRSLENPTGEKWKVKKDGGVFDQFTGATITPRAVVKAVHNALLYYQQHRDELFAAAGADNHEENGHG